MNELDIRDLHRKAKRKPWCWLRFARETILVCERLLDEREQHQHTKDNHHLLNLEVAELRKHKDELRSQHANLKGGLATMFEFIRRTKANDNNGKIIPDIFTKR